MARSIIFGSNGYIGRHMTSALRASGQSVVGVGIEDQTIGETDAYHQVDCTDSEKLLDLDFDVDAVYVFAGYTGTQAGFTEYKRFLDLNDRVLLNILNAVRISEHNPRIVFPSTRLVYKGVEKTPLVETSEKEAKTLYAQNKLSCESYLNMFANAFGIEYTIFRICVPYGNIFGGEYSYGTIGFFLKMARSGKRISLYGDGNLMRTFSHVEDITAAIIATLKRPESVNQTYNIGGNDDMSLFDIAQIIATKYSIGVEFAPWPQAALKIESGDTIFNDQKIRALTGLSYTNNFAEWVNTLD